MQEDEPTTITVTPTNEEREKPAASIMDAFKEVLGEELMKSMENRAPSPGIGSRPLPSIPSPNRDRGLSLEGPPPEVPQRTTARLELVEVGTISTSLVGPTYDVPGAVSISSIDDDYEMPTEMSIHVVGGNSSVPGPAIHSPSLAPPPSSPAPYTTPVTGSGNKNGSSQLAPKGIGRFFKSMSRKEPKKKSNTSPEDAVPGELSNLLSGSATMPNLSAKVIEDKYRFPGRLGFGIRLEAPNGPREEPQHWKSISLPTAIHVT